jgi:hypothetical protein
MKNYLEILARKGDVTIVEHAGGKTIIAVEACGNVMTLEGGQKDQLLAEMCAIFKNWPDAFPEKRI